MDGELTDRDKARTLAHIEGCPSCRALLSRFENLQAQMENELCKHKPPEYISALLMARIAREDGRRIPIQKEKKPRLTGVPVFAPAAWLKAGSVAVIFFLAVFGGMQLHRVFLSTPGTQQPEPQLVAETVPIQDNIDDYLEKSAIVFLQIKNSQIAQDYEEEKRLAKELLVESKLVSKKMKGTQYNYLRPLIDEIEPVLWDVANLDDRRDKGTLNLLRESIDSNDYLLKLNLARAGEKW